MKIPVILCGASILLAGAAAAGEVQLRSPAGRQVSLVELYTSEGCSSCPPAEAWLSGLGSSSRLWRDFVPISFHVDYWDNLGWRDRFAAPAWTQRQRAYASQWGSGTVYTPGFVRDGQEWQRTGAAPGEGGNPAQAGMLTAVVKDNRTVTVTYRPVGGASGGRRVSVALLGAGLSSSVKAGENSGRDLRHDFVALSCETKAFAREQPITFDLPEAPANASRLALAVWVNTGAGVEQSAGGWLK